MKSTDHLNRFTFSDAPIKDEIKLYHIADLEPFLPGTRVLS